MGWVLGFLGFDVLSLCDRNCDLFIGFEGLVRGCSSVFYKL